MTRQAHVIRYCVDLTNGLWIARSNEAPFGQCTFQVPTGTDAEGKEVAQTIVKELNYLAGQLEQARVASSQKRTVIEVGPELKKFMDNYLAFAEKTCGMPKSVQAFCESVGTLLPRQVGNGEMEKEEV